MSSAPSAKITAEDLPLFAKGLIEAESDPIALLANLSALIFEALEALNWAGFYRLSGEELVLGPFQGRIACSKIPLGKGVCGTSAQKRQTLRIGNVHDFPGHIACDSASESEMVIPVLGAEKCYGVLDLDSPHQERFSASDQIMLEGIVRQLGKRLDEISAPSVSVKENCF